MAMAEIERQGVGLDAGEQFGAWWRSWTLGVVSFWIIVYLLLFHLLIHVPARLLYGPAVVHIGATVLIGPLVFRALMRFKDSKKRDFGMFFLSASLLLFSAAMCWIYAGLRSGLLPREDTVVIYTIGVLGSLLGPLTAFSVRKLSGRRTVVSNGPE